MSDELSWEEPPARTSAGRPANPAEVKIAETLINNPEKWAKVHAADELKKVAALAQSIRSGKRAGYAKALENIEGRFEVAVRRLDDDMHGLFVRYTTSKAKAAKKTAPAKPAPAAAPAAPAPEVASPFAG